MSEAKLKAKVALQSAGVIVPAAAATAPTRRCRSISRRKWP